MKIKDGVYKVYNVTSDGIRRHYQAIAHFQIANDQFIPLEDATGFFARSVPAGPLTPDSKRMLKAFCEGSYRYVVEVQPGIVYLPSFTA